jgi:type IV pilus assembly protein PilM
MAGPREAWGIEIGAYAIKAIRLERDGDAVSVSDFAVIPHKKVLTTPDIDQDDIIRLSLGQFISQKSLEGEHLVMSVPGHAAFARFAKLPPVEPKKIPDIVKFEAVQQIPFPIDEVEWDYQTFASDDSPEIEVGIFAITRERVQQRLGLYGELGVSPESLTLSPVAIYNAMEYDQNLEKRKGPVIFLDIGTQATDVVIADEGRCWIRTFPLGIRTFPLGGTHFTEAIASAFKLSYSKAEKLKKEAATSKYAKQIMQAMRPVFSDLLQDLQRSIGYYQSLNPDRDLTDMVGIGSTFKIPGLRKFIGQQLQINVVRLDEYAKIAVTGREAASFAEHAVNMASAYGLALQGVGLSEIDANLVPVRALREQMWHSKTKWFAAAAAVIVAGAATTLYHPLKDRGQLSPGGAPPEVTRALNTAQGIKRDYEQARSDAAVGYRAKNVLQLTDHRNVWPHLVADVAAALHSTDPQPELLGSDIEAIEAIDPADRRLVRLRDLSGQYAFDPQATTRRIAVTVDVEVSRADPITFLTGTVAQWLRNNAEPTGPRAGVPYRIVPGSISCNPTMLAEVKVDADGRAQGDQQVRRPSAPRQPPRRGGGGTGQPAGRPGVPPGLGAGGGAGDAGGGGVGFGGSGGGRRTGAGGSGRPPGSDIGFGGAPPGPGSGGAAPGFGGQRAPGGRPSPGGRPAPGGGKDREVSADLEAAAPLPEAPSLYPPRSRFYRVPITFEIELLDPTAAKSATRAGAGPDRGETPS